MHQRGTGRTGLRRSSTRLSHLYLTSSLFALDKSANVIKDEKACCSNVDENRAYDYQVIFADCQRLQVLRSTLLRYKSILDTQYQIAQVCDELPQKLQLSVVESKQQFKSAIYLSKIDRHRGKVMILVWHASSIATLVRTLVEASTMAANTFIVIQDSSNSK